MNRRQFLSTTAALTATAAFAADSSSAELKRFKITRITGFRHICPRPKLVGKNARLGEHGRQTTDFVLRIATDQGVEGFGYGRSDEATARKLIGHTLAEYWKPGRGMLSPLGRADHALFDLAGKALKTPAWKLLGGKGPAKVPVYDGSIYFADLLKGNEGKGVDPLLREVEVSLEAGHRAFKIKVGRGFKWMDKEAGFRRDVEVVQAIRKRVGRDVKLMVDANNGYDLASTKKWLDALDDELFFVEEMFPETVAEDLELKAYLKKKGYKTLVADGESANEVSHFDPFIAKQALDVLQPDMRRFGFSLQWQLSQKAAAVPAIKLAPHNWGSFLGLYMQVVLARGIGNFLMAEQDTSASDLFDTSAFKFKDGLMTVPDEPGCGLRLREEVFKKKYTAEAWVAQ